MISRELLRDAVEAVTKARGETMTASSIQRRIRVGWATADQLAESLESAHVLGAWQAGGRRPILARAEEAHRMVAAAIEDGRITLTVAATPPL